MKMVDITVNKQSSIRMNTGKNVVYFDPLDIVKESHDADAIFITHDHYDHFSPNDIQKVIKADTVMIVPKKMFNMASKKAGIPIERIVTVEPGQYVEMAGGYIFQTIPAYNKIKPFHPKRAGWCGYVLTIDGKKYYVAGDTDDTSDNRKVKCDVALIPIGGKFTMDFKEAANFINVIRPEIVIPTHYGEIVGKPEDGEKFKSLVNDMIKVETKLF